MGLFAQTLSKAAKAEIRDIVREELRSELDRALSPGFIQICRDGANDLESISDAVIGSDEKLKELSLSVTILAASVEAIRTSITNK